MSETKSIYCQNRSSFNRPIFAALVSRLLCLASPFFSSEERKKELILPLIKHLSVTWDTWGWGGATALVKWPAHTLTAQEVTVWNIYGCVELWKWNTACCCTICFTALSTKKKKKNPGWSPFDYNLHVVNCTSGARQASSTLTSVSQCKHVICIACVMMIRLLLPVLNPQHTHRKRKGIFSG